MISMQRKTGAAAQMEPNSALYRDMVNEPSASVDVHLSTAGQPSVLQMGMAPMQGEVNMPGQADSWKNMMARNLGREVVISSLVGSQNTVIAQGTLYEVGNDYIGLYHAGRDSYITADLYSVRFVEINPSETGAAPN